MVKDEIKKYVQEHLGFWQDAALKIHEHPEVSNYEFFASKLLSDALRDEGFEIEMPAAGHRTGFAARATSGKPGATVVFLAEFDALAGLGHGCGHNLFGATSCLAACALKSVLEKIGGEVRVYGTPGEEGGEQGSAKGSFVREGYLDDVDFALCVHPGSGEHSLSSRCYACAPVDIEFTGRSAHAAGCPQDGINALDAQILTYNAISVLRQQLTDRIRIHGIITKGGVAPNVIPDYTKAKYYLRAADRDTLQELYEKVEHIVQGSALSTGCTGSMKLYQNLVENMVLTPGLDAVYARNMEELGQKVQPQSMRVMAGSSDVGNISQKVPTIQPHISIHSEKIPGHSIEFVEACRSKEGLESIGLGARALAGTAVDVCVTEGLLDALKKEHAYSVAHQKELPL